MVSDVALYPVAGRDYPCSWNEFLDWFPNEEACFTARSRGLLFYRLLQQAVATDPATYDEVVAPKG